MQRLIIFIALISLGINAIAQKQKPNYEFSANISGLQSGWIYKTSDDRSHVDSVKVTDGKFSFKGNIVFPERVSIRTEKGRDNLILFVDPGAKVMLAGDDGRLDEAKVSGGKTQVEYAEYLLATQKNKVEIEQVIRSFEKDSQDQVSTKLLQKRYDSLSSDLGMIIKEFVKDHPASFVSLYQLKDLVYSNDATDLLQLVNSLDGKVLQSPEAKKYQKLLTTKVEAGVGKMAKDFSARDTSNRRVRLSSFRGRYLLLDFWASWCAMPWGKSKRLKSIP